MLAESRSGGSTSYVVLVLDAVAPSQKNGSGVRATRRNGRAEHAL
jgi:hypothetical protein